MTPLEFLSAVDPATDGESSGPLPLSARAFRVDDIAEHLPYGLVVVHRDGSIVGANAAALRLIGAESLDQVPASCGELLDCRRPGGPCRRGCLVSRAADAGAPQPEIHVNAAPGIATRALWVTAAPLSRSSIVLHLRAVDAESRARRPEPGPAIPELWITAFGRGEVRGVEGSMAGAWLRQRHGVVLKYLVCHRDRTVPAEELADALWPQSGRRGINHVRRFVQALTVQLEPRLRGGQSSFILCDGDGQGYALDHHRVAIDIDLFETAAHEGLEAARDGQHDVADERLEHAVAIYRGDLFADEPHAEWMLAERDRLRVLASACMRELADIRIAANDLRRALPVLERLAALEPLNVEVHRSLLQVCIAQGRRKETTRRYATYKARMASELGEGPGFTLADVGFSRRDEAAIHPAGERSTGRHRPVDRPLDARR